MPDNFHGWLASRPSDQGEKVVISEFFNVFGGRKPDLNPNDPPVRREIGKVANMLGLPYWSSDPHLRYAFLHVLNVMHPTMGVGGMIIFPTMQIISDAIREDHPDPDDPDDPDLADLRHPAVRHGGTPVKLYFFLHSAWGGVHKDAKPQAGFKDMNNANYPDDPWPPRRRARGGDDTDTSGGDGSGSGAGGPGGGGGSSGGGSMSVADIIRAWPERLGIGRMDDAALAALAQQLGEALRRAGHNVADSTPEELADAAGRGKSPASPTPARPAPARPVPSPTVTPGPATTPPVVPVPRKPTGPITGDAVLPVRTP